MSNCKRNLCSVVVAVLLIFTMTACTESKDAYSRQNLVDLGIEVTKTMQEMVYSEDYVSFYFSDSHEYEDEIGKFQATDYASPIAVYSVEMPGAKVLLSQFGSENADRYDSLSDGLKEQLNNRVSFSTVVSSVNGRAGAKTMALCSVFTATKRSKDLKLDESVVYLYIFEEGMPIVVTFTEAGYANGQFIVLDNVKSHEDISQFFNSVSCKVEKIKEF